MAFSNFTPNERLMRRRFAARLRQRRCRQRKREKEAAVAAQRLTGDENSEGVGEISHSNSPTRVTHHFLDNKPMKAEVEEEQIQQAVVSYQPTPVTWYESHTMPPLHPPPHQHIQHHHQQQPVQYHQYHYQHHAPPPFQREQYHRNGGHPPPPQGYHHAGLQPPYQQPHSHFQGTIPMMPNLSSNQSHQLTPSTGVNGMHPSSYHLSMRPPHPMMDCHSSSSGYQYHQQQQHGYHGPPMGPPSSLHQVPLFHHQQLPTYGPSPPPPPPSQSLHEPESASVSRTVSRSPSDASLQSYKPLGLPAGTVGTVKTTIKKKESRKYKSRLLSTEKAAVAAMLSLKSSSDDSDVDENDDSEQRTLPVMALENEIYAV